ncbi:uncharacterized protein LOC143578518 [Bidens hawaiensis]|uniref:uncharacterized protein LOC143578518 n=1 Tax=Bidens hawaiensis TaxID=980011 RepID=UPI004049F364
MVGNEYAAQLLVQKREELLGIKDHNQQSPLDSAFANNKHNMSAYLLKLTPSSEFCDASMFDLSPILTAIDTKQYAFKNVREKTILKGSLLFHSNIMDQCVDDTLQCVRSRILRRRKKIPGSKEHFELDMSPGAVNCKDDEGHNVIQLAVLNRSAKVYNLIRHIVEQTESFRTMTYSSKDNLVHLAGRLAPSFVLDRTTGAALQLKRELIWREEVEKLMLPLERIDENADEETPAMVFTKEHRDLMKQGEEWMKATAESCSITAALIVTIVFAAAITVPGGSNQDSGIPVLKKESAITIFAVFNAFSLFTATTALLLFLSILTARFSERDFLVSLPRRLILGLFTLFLSTTAMIVAFGAVLLLVFCDQRPWMLAPICLFACLPISVIVTIKVPFLVDLIRSTYVPIFGKQRYLESCKISEKNTLFTN